MRKPAHASLILAAVLAASAPALAWHDEGHVYAARAAVEALPDDVPAFFREGRDTIAHGSLDPDVVRSKALPQLRDADAPEHYLDLELLRGRPLPPTRSEFIALCHELGVPPDKAGTLPYAIAERAQWLTMAFAEHRRHPDNPHIRMKCLVLAGILSHYTADLHMPLHTTVHFNGRVEGWDPAAVDRGEAPAVPKTPFTKVHEKVDALPTKVPFAELFAEPLAEPRVAEAIFPFTVEELKRSHALVDRVYELEPRVPAMAEMAIDDPEVRAFTKERIRASAEFTRDVILSAWRSSATLEPPDWLDRRVFDESFDPTKVPPQPAP